jgi:hypothetical protein
MRFFQREAFTLAAGCANRCFGGVRGEVVEEAFFKAAG